uniref:Uncharacterized protein n=1 Tax=Anguilla anguilla TaxID=7936 RepID=A0A0E9UXY9_ANGAN
MIMLSFFGEEYVYFYLHPMVRHSGNQTLFLEICHPVGFHFNPNLAHLILLISSPMRSLAVE